MVDLPRAPLSITEQIRAISEEWVADKGLPEMGFTLGGLDELDDEQVRCLIAIDTDHTVHGITSFLPVYRDGQIIGWALDFMRRRTTGFSGVMEFLIATAAVQFRDEGAEFLSLSGAPLARVDRGDDRDAVQRLLDMLGRVLEPVYGFQSLLDFKAKFQPTYQPLWMSYPDPPPFRPSRTPSPSPTSPISPHDKAPGCSENSGDEHHPLGDAAIPVGHRPEPAGAGRAPRGDGSDVMGDVSLQTGWLPWLILALGGVAGAFLLCRPQQSWWLYVVPTVVVIAAVAAWLIGDVGGEKLFAKPLNTSDDVWIAVGLSALWLAVGSWYRSTWRRKIIAVLAAVVVVIAAGNQINRTNVQFPAVRDLFGVPTADQVGGLPPVLPAPTDATTAAASSTLPAVDRSPGS